MGKFFKKGIRKGFSIVASVVLLFNSILPTVPVFAGSGDPELNHTDDTWEWIYVYDKATWDAAYSNWWLAEYYEAHSDEDLWCNEDNRAANYNDRLYKGTFNETNVERASVAWVKEGVQSVTIAESTYYAPIFYGFDSRDLELFTTQDLDVSAGIFKITNIKYKDTCVPAWSWALNAPESTLPWIVVKFKDNYKWTVKFNYSDWDLLAYPWIDKWNDWTKKTWANSDWWVASLSKEFEKNEFKLSANGFHIDKFSAELVPGNTLTVHYEYSDHTPAAEDYTWDLLSWFDYSITSPVIEWYTASQTTVSGIMWNTAKEITVTYTPIEYEISWTYRGSNGEWKTTTWDRAYWVDPVEPEDVVKDLISTASTWYTFTWWSPLTGAVTEATWYTAQYSEEATKYLITFYDDDWTTELTWINFAYWTMPSYTPKKTNFTLSWWNPALVEVTEATWYTAIWESMYTWSTDEDLWDIKRVEVSAGTTAQTVSEGVKAIPQDVEIVSEWSWTNLTWQVIIQQKINADALNAEWTTEWSVESELTSDFVADTGMVADMQWVIDIQLIYLDADWNPSNLWKVNFNQPVAIKIPVKWTNPVKVRVKHTWETSYGTGWLTLDPNATCNTTDWTVVEADKAYTGWDISVSNNMVIIYTCSASSFVAFTEAPKPEPSTNRSSWGGGSSRSKATTETNTWSVATWATEWTEVTNPEENTNEEEANKPMTEWEAIAIFWDEQIAAYKWALENGITTMKTVEEARLDQPLTRAELAKMMVVYMEKVLDTDVARTNVAVEYKDVDKLLWDLYNYIQYAYNYKIMWINADGTPIEYFNPNGIVTRWEYATVFSRVLFGSRFNKEWADFYTNHLEALKAAWILKDTTPTMQEIRWWVMLMMYRSSQNTEKIQKVAAAAEKAAVAPVEEAAAAPEASN